MRYPSCLGEHQEEEAMLELGLAAGGKLAPDRLKLI
jgi:hypothetical protein